MTGPIATKASKNQIAGLANGHSQEQPRQPAFAGPQAEVLALQRAAGNRAVSQLMQGATAGPAVIQAKLTIGQPGDRFEHEADYVAKLVTHAPNHEDALQIQQRCADCDDRLQGQSPNAEVDTEISRAPLDPVVAPEVVSTLAHQIQALNGNGRPLPENIRAAMESRFGIGFADVRLHTDAQADGMARALNARAFTWGRNVVFAAGQYAPHTLTGRLLLAHELTHVVQQRGGIAARDNGSTHHSLWNGAPSAVTHSITAGSPAVPIVQRQPLQLGAGVVGGLAGNAWLRLSDTMKSLLIDRGIDATLKIVDKFPGKAVLGEMWIFVREALIGLFTKLKSAKKNVKIQVMDKIAAIMTGQSVEYAKGLLVGLLKGFFLDGLLGIFIALWELVKGLVHLWDFFDRIAQIIGGFPDEIEQMLDSFRSLGQELWQQKDQAIQEIKALIADPKQMASLVGAIIKQGKAYAKQGGEKLADALLDFFTKPGAEAAIGETAGRVMGAVLFEVILAIVTAGGGAAVTGAKTAIKAVAKFLGKVASKVAKGFIMLFREAHLVFGKLVDVIKAAARFVKGKILSRLSERFAKLLDDIKAFFAMLMRNCHETVLKCKLPSKKPTPKKPSKPAPKGGLKPRNIYPDFEGIPPAMRSTARAQVKRLSTQLGQPIPKDRILAAPWIGRIRTTSGKTRSVSTSQGWLRNESRFWKKWKEAFPQDAKLLGPGNTVTPELAKKYRWPTSGPNNAVGQKLIHHHIDNGPFTVAIPKSWHEKMSGAIHAVPKVVRQP